MKGYVHINQDEAFFVDWVEIVEKESIIQPYDEYVGYMETDEGTYLVFFTVDGNYKAYLDMTDYNTIINILETNIDKASIQYLIDTNNKTNFYHRFYNSMVGKTLPTIKKNAKRVTVDRLQDIYC